MCEWKDKVRLLVPIPANRSCDRQFGWKYKTIDKCIAPIIKALNDGGIYTDGCCCGHGKYDGSILLHDGRTIKIS